MDRDKVVILTSSVSGRSKDLTAALTLAGYEVLTIAKKRNWLTILRRESPDLIIINNTFGNGIGLGFCKTIRAADELGLVPILMVGELPAETVSVAEALEAGAADYLKLPLEPLTFTRKVAELIERKRRKQKAGSRERHFQELIRESEEKFKNQYKTIPFPAYMWKRSGSEFVFEGFNDAAEKAAGQGLSSFIGMTAAQVFADSPKLRRALKKCADEEKPIQFELPYRYKAKGEVRQLDFNFVFTPPDTVTIYTHDVTELKETIDSLRVSQNRFQLVSRATNEVLWEWDLKNNLVWWNENLQKVFGYRKKNIEPGVESWSRNIHPADYERVFGSIQKVIESGQNYWTSEFRYRRSDGEYAYVLDRGYVERDSKGKSVKMIGAMTDITKRKKAENDLRESKERLAIAQQVAEIGSFDWNLHTNEIITSKQLEKIYGADENFNNSYDYWLRFVHPDDVLRVERDMNRVIEEGELDNEFRIITGSGDIRWIHSHIKVFRDDADQPYRIVGINIDITKRRNAEEALRKSEEQLRQSQKLESVGRLAGGIAHDFNNMLTAINGYSDLILRTLAEDSPLRRKVIEIKKAGERSAQLTQQLLAFSRRQILQPKLIDLNQIVSDMSQMLNRLIGEDIQLSIDLLEDTCCVEADPGQLSQVLMNLVINSRDAMPEGGKLRICTDSVKMTEKDVANHPPMVSGHYVILGVEDTGSGIDDETLQYIFEPFFTTKKAGMGTGLGLATVYGIVKQSGGYIWVESEPGRGTNFRVFLPFIKADELIPQKTDRHAASPSRGNETILLVEDEKSVRGLIRQILQTYGYTVIEAENGIEALKICQESKPKINLLITDIVMPQMNGRRLAEDLKQIYPQIKVLFTSGYVGDKALLDSAENRDKNFIAKPFTSNLITDKVRKILDEIE